MKIINLKTQLTMLELKAYAVFVICLLLIGISFLLIFPYVTTICAAIHFVSAYFCLNLLIKLLDKLIEAIKKEMNK